MNYFEAKQKLIEHNNSREYYIRLIHPEYYVWQDTFESKVLKDKLCNAVITTYRQTGELHVHLH